MYNRRIGSARHKTQFYEKSELFCSGCLQALKGTKMRCNGSPESHLVCAACFATKKCDLIAPEDRRKVGTEISTRIKQKKKKYDGSETQV